jgi:hypothetical protein
LVDEKGRASAVPTSIPEQNAFIHRSTIVVGDESRRNLTAPVALPQRLPVFRD